MKKALPSALLLLPLLLLPCACGRAVPFAELPKTDARLAFRYAEKSVSFGNRFSGSEAIRRYADWIRDTAAQSDKFHVSFHTFTERTPAGEIVFRNILAEIPGKSSDFVLIGAHYDAKRFLTLPDFQAANDGASGVAALLVMIRALQAYPTPPPLTVRLVFFDGEECLYHYSANDGLHGSRALAEAWAGNGQLKKCRAMILLDMIGDRDLNLTLPANSSPRLLEQFRLLADEFFPHLRYRLLPYDMTDDHVPFLARGVPALDLIDFEYGPSNSYWHTAGDTLDRISGDSIKTAADLALALIWRCVLL